MEKVENLWDPLRFFRFYLHHRIPESTEKSSRNNHEVVKP
jgi:hypothetical protein